MKGIVETKKTERGFALVEFEDTYGERCSVQESSASGGFLWIGIASPRITRFTPSNERTPPSGEGLHESLDITEALKTTPNSRVLVHSRMHLDKKQVRELSKILNNWLRAGSLSGEAQ